MDGLEIDVVNVIKNKRKPYGKKSPLKIKKEDDKTVRFILPIDPILESTYGFDKKYFESTFSSFYNLFNL